MWGLLLLNICAALTSAAWRSKPIRTNPATRCQAEWESHGAPVSMGWETQGNAELLHTRDFFFLKWSKSDVISCFDHYRLAFILQTAEPGHALLWEPNCLSDLLWSNALCPKCQAGHFYHVEKKLTSESQQSRSDWPLENMHNKGGRETPQNSRTKPLIGFFSAIPLCRHSHPSQTALCCLQTAETQPIFVEPVQLMILCVTNSVIHIVCAGREFPTTFYLSQSLLAV